MTPSAGHEAAAVDRRSTGPFGWHSLPDAGCPFTDRLVEAGLQASIGTVADSDDNALAETVNELYKAELVYGEGPWRGPDDLELATLGWVDWFNHTRLSLGVKSVWCDVA